MADQDDFDPVGRDWRRAYDQCAGGEHDRDQIGESLLRALTRMLQHSGGCTIFDDLDAGLEQVVMALSAADDELARRRVFGEFSAELDRIARRPGVIDRRLDVVALRTARSLGAQALTGTFVPGVPGALRHHLGAHIVQNVLCHRALDAARAHAVGLAFTTHARAHEYHDRLIEALSDHIARVGRQLATDPTGRRVRHLRLVPSQTTTAMLWDDAWRLDVDDPRDDGATGDGDPDEDLQERLPGEDDADTDTDTDEGETHAELMDLFGDLDDLNEDEADDDDVVGGAGGEAEGQTDPTEKAYRA